MILAINVIDVHVHSDTIKKCVNITKKKHQGFVCHSISVIAAAPAPDPMHMDVMPIFPEPPRRRNS
jgi:hypothetical protein